MAIFAQAGLGAAGAGIAGILFIVWVIAILAPLLFLFLWYLPDIFQLVSDWVRGRDFLAESEFDRKYEGRIFGPNRDQAPPGQSTKESENFRDS